MKAEVAGSNPAEPIFFFQSVALEPFIEGFSDSRIMAKKKHNEEKKLHNSHEKCFRWRRAQPKRFGALGFFLLGQLKVMCQ